jgi:hypothetical protein
MAAVPAVIKPKSVERLAMPVDRQQITSDSTNLLLNLAHRQTTGAFLCDSLRSVISHRIFYSKGPSFHDRIDCRYHDQRQQRG